MPEKINLECILHQSGKAHNWKGGEFSIHKKKR